MAYDGIMLNSIISELKNNLMNGRIDKIYQPEVDELILLVRGNGANHRLLLSASSQNPRIHLSTINKNNPAQPPMFCMLLRKHITSGRIVEINQYHFDRICEICIESKNEMGDMLTKRLIIEIMGRHSNIILIDDTYRIIDSIKRVSADMSRIRQILPGLTYTYPESPQKISPLDETHESFCQKIDAFSGDRYTKFLMQSYNGLSRQTAQELSYISTNDVDYNFSSNTKTVENLYTGFHQFFEKVVNQSFDCYMLTDSTQKPIDFMPLNYSMFSDENMVSYESPSELTENYYRMRDIHERVTQKTANLTRSIKTHLERAQKKLAKQLTELETAENADKYRLYGELLTAYLYQIKQGDELGEVLDYTSPNQAMITIPLDKRLTPNQNAQRYFKKYSKSKNAIIALNEQITECRHEIDYLEMILFNISQCETDDEIAQIRAELVEQGYTKSLKRGKGRTKLKISAPLHYQSSDGYDIFVGKNNYQNDDLTMKQAKSHDIWFHTKHIPGSHVILKTHFEETLFDIPDKTIVEAANLAAFHSKAKSSDKVDIDYCIRKNIRKPNGSKPGMVIYEGYYTINVSPKNECKLI